jgi:hypothetical protein
VYRLDETWLYLYVCQQRIRLHLRPRRGLVNAAEENGANYCKASHGKTIFSALYGTYTETLDELKAVFKASTIAGQTNLTETTGQQTTQEAKAARHTRNRRNFSETGSAEQNIARPQGSRHLKLFRLPQSSGHGHRRFRYWGHFKKMRQFLAKWVGRLL